MAEEYILARPAPITISAEETDRLLDLGSGDAALLYLYILRNAGRFDPERAAKELHLSGSLRAAAAQLRGVGLILGDAGIPPEEPKEQPELPEYTAAEVKARADTDESFRMLLSETSDRLGRVLSGADMKILFGIYNDRGLPAEVILLLIGWCMEETERLYGAGKKPSLRQIEKEAYIWAREGLFTLELADGYIREHKRYNRDVAAVARELGIQGRRIAQKELNYIGSWLAKGFGVRAIALAYERTVIQTGELRWSYLNKIIENWHSQGLHTPAEIEAGDKPPKSGKKPSAEKKTRTGPDASEYDRMQDYLNRLNGGGNDGA